MTKFLKKKCAFKFAAIGFLCAVIVAVGTTSSFAQAQCGDTDSINALYEKFLENYKIPNARTQAVAVAKEYLYKYGGCEALEEQVEYLRSFIKRQNEKEDIATAYLAVSRHHKTPKSFGSIYMGQGTLSLRNGALVYVEGEGEPSDPKYSFRLPCEEFDHVRLAQDFHASWTNKQNPYYGTVYRTDSYVTFTIYRQEKIVRQFLLARYASETRYANGGGRTEAFNDHAKKVWQEAQTFGNKINSYCGK